MNTEYKLIHINLGVIDNAAKLQTYLKPFTTSAEKHICIVFHLDDKLLLNDTLFSSKDLTELQHDADQYINSLLTQKTRVKENRFHKYLKTIIKFYPHVIRLLDNMVSQLSRTSSHTLFTYVILPVLAPVSDK